MSKENKTRTAMKAAYCSFNDLKCNEHACTTCPVPEALMQENDTAHMTDEQYLIDRYDTLIGKPPTKEDYVEEIEFVQSKRKLPIPLIMRTLPSEKLSAAMIGEIKAYTDFLYIIEKVYGDDITAFQQKLIEHADDKNLYEEEIWTLTDNFQLFFGLD